MTKVWMQVYPLYTKVIQHIVDELAVRSPSNIEFVEDWLDADIIIENIVGTPDRTNLVHWREKDWSEDIKLRAEVHEGPLFYIAHCSIVDDDFFRTAFGKADKVFGFLNYENTVGADYTYVRMPWGVDPDVFKRADVEKTHTAYTWGCSIDPDTEGITSIYEAVKAVDGVMLHSGIDYGFEGKWYDFIPPAKDYYGVAERLNRVQFANALRREEGFELMGIQGLLCGAQPLYFDLPCYRYWFDKVGVFVSEDNTVEDLIKVFSSNYLLTEEQRQYVLDKFSWNNVAKHFWGCIEGGELC